MIASSLKIATFLIPVSIVGSNRTTAPILVARESRKTKAPAATKARVERPCALLNAITTRGKRK